MDFSYMSLEQLLDCKDKIEKQIEESYSFNVEIVTTKKCELPYILYNIHEYISKECKNPSNSDSGSDSDSNSDSCSCACGIFPLHNLLLLYIVKNLAEINKKLIPGVKIKIIRLSPLETYNENYGKIKVKRGKFIPSKPLPEKTEELFWKFLINNGHVENKTKLE